VNSAAIGFPSAPSAKYKWTILETSITSINEKIQTFTLHAYKILYTNKCPDLKLNFPS
jgi:hypothetical protein